MRDLKAITTDEARAVVPYAIDSNEACFAVSTAVFSVCVYRHDGVWHAYGETKDGDEVDTLWADAGTCDLMQMMRDVLGVV